MAAVAGVVLMCLMVHAAPLGLFVRATWLTGPVFKFQVPLQSAIGKAIGSNRRAMLKHTDERVKLMSEILQGT